MVGVIDFSSPAGVLFWLGLAGVVIGLLVAGLGRMKSAQKWGLIVIVASVVVVLLGQVIGAAAPPASTNVPNAPANATLSSYVSTSLLQSATATVWNANTQTLTAYLVQNYTTGANCLSFTNVTCSTYGIAAGKPNYLLVPIHSARTDNLNATYSFNYQVASVPTFTSIGTSPTTCSPVGFTTATSTTPGQWKAYWSAGQNSGQLGQQNAPSVTTGVAPDPTPVTAFSSVTNILHISLSGANSTAFGANCYGAVQIYSPVNMVISIGGSTPSTITVSFVWVGEHA
jgi:hypothetical protein